MSDEKNRLGEKFKDVEAAREDQWARQRDAELLESMRKRMEHIACPHCKEFLEAKHDRGIHMLVCPKGEGAWLDQKALNTLMEKAGK
ncbi:MAG: zf-TFIIB domain-containing protein [Candidatus Binatus sp.]|uniref:zf-TFIIB domain-containing protein n=1 Tax=Candidatus Binatus sp. TaxID=2811406 RepID=UPI002721F3B4|nr:zf-TFIIB domain-containing protein [Candidatus Binatus sp.]MDO8433601.1 zf-TFIIB domain-containing protein [Candidatus Binatus sp.]